VERAVLLGSGGEMPTGRRETCAALLRDGEQAVLVDAGTGTRRLFTEPGLIASASRLDVVLTHFHADHVCGLVYLNMTGLPLVVWGPGQALYGHATADILRRFVSPPLSAHPLEDLVEAVEELPVGGIDIGPFTVRTRRQDNHSDPTLGLRFGDEVTYCTDTGADPATAEFAAGARVLCHEAWFEVDPDEDQAAHCSAPQAGRLARAAGVERLILIHLDPSLPDHSGVLAAARREFPSASLGEDGLEIWPAGDDPRRGGRDASREHPTSLEDVRGECEETLRVAAATLRRGDVPFVLGGSMASWARGGPLSHKDVDLFVKPVDAERALGLLATEGMRTEQPPEQWLFKAWNGHVLVDLIFEPIEGPVTDERIAAAEWLPVLGVWMHVASLEDVLVGRLLASSEQRLDFAGPVEIARALRERIDWAQVRRRTSESACAGGFFALLEGLGVISGDDARPGPA
jgi:ribonuclease BN (tRNA processing enzyme)